MSESKKKFDPEGPDYDMESAVAAGITPGENGHWPSREPKSGLLLKGKQHETWNLLEKGEEEAGYKIYKADNGRYYSRKKSKFDDWNQLQKSGPEE